MISINGNEVIFTTFPNGETNVNGDIINSITPYSVNTVMFKYENDGDLIKLMFVKKHLSDKQAQLCIMYMPYSRQDRVEGKSVFTLKFICEFINSLNFTSVILLEPHSDVVMALLNNSTAVYPTTGLLAKAIAEIGFDKHKDYIFYPDAGAQKRYSGKNPGFREMVGFKKRNFQTGKIEELKIVGCDQDITGSKVIIVDDLCSYGGTFIMSAEKLLELGVSQVYLVVTHCENSILSGKIPCTDRITKVFTTDSILSLECKKVDINKIRLENFYD